MHKGHSGNFVMLFESTQSKAFVNTHNAPANGTWCGGSLDLPGITACTTNRGARSIFCNNKEMADNGFSSVIDKGKPYTPCCIGCFAQPWNCSCRNGGLVCTGLSTCRTNLTLLQLQERLLTTANEGVDQVSIQSLIAITQISLFSMSSSSLSLARPQSNRLQSTLEGVGLWRRLTRYHPRLLAMSQTLIPLP